MNESVDAPRPEPMRTPLVAPPPLARSPSRAAHTVGVLSLIFGGVAALNGLWQVLGGLSGPVLSSFWKNLPGPGGEHGGEMARRTSEAYEIMASATWAQVTQGLILLILSVALIPIGLGQLRFRRWAVRASCAWAVSALIALVVILVLQATVVSPAMREAMARMSEDLREGGRLASGLLDAMGSLATTASLVGTVVFYAPYPVILLVLFTRPRVVASLSA